MKMCGPYEVPYIPHGLRHEETILQIANALDYLNFVVNDVFSLIEKKAEEQQQRLMKLKIRTSHAKCKVDKLNGCKKATVVCKFCMNQINIYTHLLPILA